ncbi:MAG: hypothetical protein GY748_24415 [Planctomycetaceae bacterium]|nr:hypothetical protein [Planctomycetaceae bacterium]
MTRTPFDRWVQGERSLPREWLSGDTLAWLGKAQCLETAICQRDATGERQRHPCHDGVV